MKMHVLSGGRLRMSRSTYIPDAKPEESIVIPVLSMVLKHPNGNVIFDTGCHPGAAADGDGRWSALIDVVEPVFRQEDALVNQLSKTGLAADDIDVVVCSHLHIDHCGCNAFFKKATVICHARELEYATADGADSRGYMREDWEPGPAPETMEGQRDLFGDGKLTLISAPGHTPGSIIAHAVLDRDGAFVLASDAVPMRCCLDQRYAPMFSWNHDQTVQTMDEIARLEKDGATVIFGHDDDQWTGLRKGEAFYE